VFACDGARSTWAGGRGVRRCAGARQRKKDVRGSRVLRDMAGGHRRATRCGEQCSSSTVRKTPTLRASRRGSRSTRGSTLVGCGVGAPRSTSPQRPCRRALRLGWAAVIAAPRTCAPAPTGGGAQARRLGRRLQPPRLARPTGGARAAHALHPVQPRRAGRSSSRQGSADCREVTLALPNS
jgi:hypothetical protein